MMRVCHLDTCPVGVATQNPELRARFSGKPEFVETFFEYIAEEVREHLAALGFRTLAEAIGHVESLHTDRAVEHWKAAGLDLTPVLTQVEDPTGGTAYQTVGQDHGLEKALDHQLIALAQGALHEGERVRADVAVRNVNRTVGTMLGHEVTKLHPHGLPDGTIELTLTGSSGQSFGAFVPSGITLVLQGDANDYLGKGLSGGRLVVRPDRSAPLTAEHNVIAGNVVAYGATTGEIFLRGQAGERFCVRNSGAAAVVEGVGDHGCEYMTGGTVVVLGPTGRNFAAGMSGGVGYVLDLRPELVNPDLVDLDPVARTTTRRSCAGCSSRTATGPSRRWPSGCSSPGRRAGAGSPSCCRATTSASSTSAPRPRPRASTSTARRSGSGSWRRPVADPQGFLKVRERELPTRRPVPVRIKDWHEVYQEQELGQLQRQAGRCMDCGIPFCHNGCPLGNLIPEWNDLAWRGDWTEAIERLHATNNFPEFTGRLCPAPCETACVLGINQPAVTIKQVEVTTIEQAFEGGLVTPQPPERLSGKTVAVIGSGPAGLAAAQQLTRAGHTVAVYERGEKAGGLLRYGIPEFKMEKSVLDRRLAQMEAEGTRFRNGVLVGDEITGQQLVDRYDAVVLAIGATVARDLPVPGRELRGVYQAMEYLPQGNRAALGQSVPDQILATGLDVVIIGGGDTGADCLGTAHRQGARSVTQLEIMPRPTEERPSGQPWPTYPMTYRVSSAHEEGGDRVYAVNTERFLGDDDGRVRALKLVEVEMRGGRFEPVEGSEREIPAQLVLLAMGFLGPEKPGLVEQLGVDLDERSNVKRDKHFMSSVPGVFVAGDAGRGQSLIVWAIAEGRAAANGVDQWLTGSSQLPRPINPTDRPLLV